MLGWEQIKVNLLVRIVVAIHLLLVIHVQSITKKKLWCLGTSRTLPFGSERHNFIPIPYMYLMLYCQFSSRRHDTMFIHLHIYVITRVFRWSRRFIPPRALYVRFRLIHFFNILDHVDALSVVLHRCIVNSAHLAFVGFIDLITLSFVSSRSHTLYRFLLFL